MRDFPILIDNREAIEYYQMTSDLTDAEKAYIVGILFKTKYTNQMVRKELNIQHVYTVSHLKLASSLTLPELELWHKNPRQITLGHVRAIAKQNSSKRESLLRDTLNNKLTVKSLLNRARGIEDTKDYDIVRYERLMSETIGRPIKIDFSQQTLSGKLILSFAGLDDLDALSRQLGFDESGRF